MISLNIKFTEPEYRKLLKAKAMHGQITWARFFLKYTKRVSVHKQPKYCACGLRLKSDAEKRESVCHNCK